MNAFRPLVPIEEPQEGTLRISIKEAIELGLVDEKGKKKELRLQMKTPNRRTRLAAKAQARKQSGPSPKRF